MVSDINVQGFLPSSRPLDALPAWIKHSFKRASQSNVRYLRIAARPRESNWRNRRLQPKAAFSRIPSVHNGEDPMRAIGGEGRYPWSAERLQGEGR
jgi:hypothetical protein